MRATPKPIIAAIPGWTTGGGHSLMVVADMAVASRENARFKQVDANVGSFDAGYGSALLARQIGDKRGLTIAGKSPQAIRMLKYAFNMADDGIAGQQAFAGEATRMAYMTPEAQEGRDAFLEHRSPDWSSYPYYF